MKRVIFGLLLFINLKLDALSKQPKNIYVFGDSHAWFNHKIRFSGDISFVSVENVSVLFKIRASPSVTMHRVGRDGLAYLDVTTYGIKSSDIVIFNFGEVDCRCHIGKQRDQSHQGLDIIIDRLAMAYINTIVANKKLIPNVTYAIMSVLPPTDQGFNSSVPYYGTLADRIQITNFLNRKLNKLCQENGLIFLDIAYLYSDQDGALKVELSDGIVHVGEGHNRSLKECVVKTLLDHKVLL